MGLTMVALMSCTLVCLGIGRQRSLFAGWVPAILMLAAALVGIPAGGGAWLAALSSAGMLVIAGGLAARGNDRPMALHRGLSAVAMAAANVTAMGSSGSTFDAAAHTHAGGVVGLVVLAINALVIAAGAAVVHRETSAEARAGAVTVARVATIAEVVLMTAAVLVMSLH